MSEANKLLVKRWFEQVWNQKSEAAIDESLLDPKLSRLSIEPSAARSLISMST